MAATLPNIVLPAATWVDLYDEANITVGVRITVEGLGGNEVFLTSSTSAPTALDRYVVLRGHGVAENETGDPGAWAYSTLGSKVNVRET